jgi:hypothetical protein
MKENPTNDGIEGAQSVVEIDKLNLDRECIRLPSDYLKYANLSADLKFRVDQLKAELDALEADLGKQIRSNPAEFGLEKVTESAIGAVVITQESYRGKLIKLQRARHQQDLAQAVVWALEHKKRSLTLLVELHGLGYFANPKLSERGKAAVEEMTKNKVRPRRRFMEED